MHNNNNNKNNSVNTLRNILNFPKHGSSNGKDYSKDKNNISSTFSSSSPPHLHLPSVSCSITQTSQNIFYSANGMAHYFVEVTSDDDGIRYGIQAYGEEAQALYKEVNGYTLYTSKTHSR